MVSEEQARAENGLSPISDHEDRNGVVPFEEAMNQIRAPAVPYNLLALQSLTQLAMGQPQVYSALFNNHPSLFNKDSLSGALLGHNPGNPIQTEPLSLKVGGVGSPSAPSNPPSDGSSGHQPSPSTSSASNPELAPSAFQKDDTCPPPAQNNWSFEEQHRQLYEISDDPLRKEFLDDLFSFWQKKGTPVTRVPIMAKQVLDLFELYRLVVAHGGLVEVINKKLWREVTKGLCLPSSITSAAFTLRTQYQKYLYAYECEKEKLSSPAELQAAIDGNRREGRRAGFAPYPSPMNRSGPPNYQEPDKLTAQQAAMAAAMYREHLMSMDRQPRKLSSAFQPMSPGMCPSENNPTPPPKQEEPQSIQSPAAANISITSRGKQLMVSMEMNGTVYAGVLFEQ